MNLKRFILPFFLFANVIAQNGGINTFSFMKFTNAAVSFGDNVSGVHGVSGLAWQNQKFKILKSVEELKKSYDKKYQELLVEMQKALMELNDCEAEHGIPDWYDRFGYMYYDFTKNQYQRND